MIRCVYVYNILSVFLQRTFPGVGLRSVVLLDQHPDEDYSVRVRCGAQQNFYKWGDWSSLLAYKTSIDRKELSFYVTFLALGHLKNRTVFECKCSQQMYILFFLYYLYLFLPFNFFDDLFLCLL